MTPIYAEGAALKRQSFNQSINQSDRVAYRQQIFLTVLEARHPTSGASPFGVWGGPAFRFIDGHLLAVPLLAEGAGSFLGPLLKGTLLTLEGSVPMSLALPEGPATKHRHSGA